MSVDDARDVNLDRLLTDWLEADAAPRAPESLEAAFVEGVASTRQRPAWATTERWISMETRAQLGVMPRALIVLLTLSLLVAALAASLALAGNLTRADDGGDGTAGLTYSTEGVIYKHTTDGAGGLIPLTGEDEYASTFAWSPDGTRFSYESWTDPQDPITIVVRDADGSNPVVVTEPFEPTPRGVKPGSHAWSPDSSRILYWTDGIDTDDGAQSCVLSGASCGQRIWSAAADGSEPAQLIGDPELDARAPVWTPDGKSIIFAGSAGGGTDWGIYRMDADGAFVKRIGDLTADGDYYLSHISISPDGTTAAVHVDGEQGDIHLVDLATGQDVLINSGWTDDLEPYWSPDGSLVAFTSWGDVPRAMLYDVVSDEVISLDIPLYVWGWSPDGRFIFGHWPDGIMTVVDVTDPKAPVATEVDDVTEISWEGWQPRP